MIEYRDEGVTSALGLGTYRNSICGHGMPNPLKADVDGSQKNVFASTNQFAQLLRF